MKIQIFTCLTHNSINYAEFLKENLINSSSKQNNLIFSAMVDDKFNSEKCSWDIKEVVKTPYDLFKGYGARNHSVMLNKIINHIDKDTDIIVICDCDVAILKKNWDLTLINLHKKYDSLITPKFSGRSSVYFTSFTKKTYMDIVPNYTPGTKESDYKVTTIYEDTGYQLQDQLVNNKVFFYNLEGFDGKEYKIEGTNRDLHYLYKIGDVNFITHFGGSHKKDFESKTVKNWIRQINIELENEQSISHS